MKVLIFLTQFYNMGGAERLAVQSAVQLNKRGVHADILSMYSGDLPGVSPIASELVENGVPRIQYLGLVVHPTTFSAILALGRLRKIVKDGDYDIVETSGISPTILCSWALRGLKCRQVVGIHQVYRMDAHNSLTHRIFKSSCRLNKQANFYCASDFAMRSWLRYSAIPESRVCRIYNSIGDEFLKNQHDKQDARRELGIPDEQSVVLYVGRLASYKGIKTLFEALAPILVERKILLLYAGAPDLNVEGTDRDLRHIQERITEGKLESCVRFLGSRDDLPRVYAAADVLAHPSRMEAFGLVLVEALACGLPVVASDSEAIPEVLNGTSSLMVRAGDETQLRVSILRVLDGKPGEFSPLSNIDHARAFSATRRIDLLEQLFEKTCGS